MSEAKRYGIGCARINDDFRQLKWSQVKADETCSEEVSAAIEYVVVPST